MSGEREVNDGEHIPPFPRLCRYLSERSPLPMVAVDGKTHVVSYVNPAFANLVGREIKELLNRPFAEAVPEGAENGCLALLDHVFSTGVPENLAEQEHRQIQPQPVYWSYAVWPILGINDRPVGVMIQVTDSTEIAVYRQRTVAMNESLMLSATRQHKLTEVAEGLSARLQAAVRARDHFLAVLSHELRNPLAAFSNGLHLLQRPNVDRAVAADSEDMMERQLKQMVRLVDDLLDISRISTGKLELHKERVELGSVVRDAVEACRAFIDSKGHQLTIALPPEPVVLHADPTRLAQVFLNLLNNAAKYSEPSQRIRLTARLAGGEIEVAVQDSGIGIPAGKLRDIFEAFMQVDTSWKGTQGGMGIGLSLVKEFVELHGGSVEARSMGSGEGSEFLVRLPVLAQDVVEPAAPTENRYVTRRRVLVVDDNRDVAASLAMLLKTMGHEVQTANDGEAAVGLIIEYRPNVVLMDLGMPNMDGFEAARRMRAQPGGAEIFLVALTGWGSSKDRKRTVDSGFDSHLVKPVDIDTLRRLLADIPIKAS